MIHTIAGRRVETEISTYRGVGENWDWMLKITGGPVLSRNSTRGEANRDKSLVDLALEFVADHIKIEEQEAPNAT